MFAAELTEAAAQRKSGNTRIGVDAHCGGKAVQLRGGIKLTKIETSLRPRGAFRRIDLNLLHAREIDDKTLVAHRCAGDVVAAGSYGEEQIARPRKVDRGNDVVRSSTIDDRAGAPIDHAVPDFSRVVIGHVSWHDHFTADRPPQASDRGVQVQCAAAVLGE